MLLSKLSGVCQNEPVLKTRVTLRSRDLFYNESYGARKVMARGVVQPANKIEPYKAPNVDQCSPRTQRKKNFDLMRADYPKCKFISVGFIKVHLQDEATL